MTAAINTADLTLGALTDLVRDWAHNHPDASISERASIVDAAYDTSAAPEVTLDAEGRVINPRTGQPDTVVSGEAVSRDADLTVTRDEGEGVARFEAGETRVGDDPDALYCWTSSDGMLVRLPVDWQDSEA